MKTIKRRHYIFAVFTILGILTGISQLIFGEIKSDLQTQLLFVFSILAGAILAVFWKHESKKLEIARLIIENPILQICTATISDITDETAPLENIKKREIFISYFGILLDSEIVRFNQSGIRLKDVEIEPNFISFTYGNEKRMQKIQLLRPALDPKMVEEISEKFRHETGIMPKLIL